MVAYYAIILLLFVSIAASIVMPIFGDMYEEIQATGVTDSLREFWHEFLAGDSSIADTFSAIGQAAGSIIEIIRANNVAVINGVIVFAVFAVLYVFFVAMANLVASDVVNNFMSSNSRFGFISNYIYNIKRSLLYALIYMVTYLPATLLVAIGSFMMTRLLFKAISVFALPLGILMFLVLQSLALTLFAGWLPAIVMDNKPIGKAIIEGPRKLFPHFGYCWMSMFVMMFLSFVFIMACTVFTFGIGFVLAFPTAVVGVKILELVLYYNASGYKFYETDKMVAEETIPHAE